jgi:hypothetical protein
MQKNQLKKPYLAPELTVVDFRVERGMEHSVQSEVEIANDYNNETLQRMINMGIIAEENKSFYLNNAPNNNAGYFMENSDGSGYFGGWN